MRRLAPFLLLALGSCAPTALWRGRSADLAHRIEVRAEDGGERAYLDGVGGARFDAISEGAVAFTAEGASYYVASDEGRWRVVSAAGPGPAFLDVVVPLRVADARVLYVAASDAGWHVVHGDAVGPAFPSPIGQLTVLPDGRVAYVGRGPDGARLVIDGAPGPAFEAIGLLAVGARGAHLVSTGRLTNGEHVVVGADPTSAHEAVLELVAAHDAPAHAAIVAAGDGTELWHAPGGGPMALLGSAPLLSHLRISDDGQHVACLSAAPDGLSIEVWRDGRVISRHRRVEGERLAFVPGQRRLTWLAEDAQGLVVHVDDWESERFERVDGPTVGSARVGFIGWRDGHGEVWIEGERIAVAPYATQLRLGTGAHHAFMIRQDGGRFVVTRRGRWPIPRFFVDTLVLGEDAATEGHWAALVPDAAERELTVWIDGEPTVTVPAEEVLGPAMAVGSDPALALRSVVEAVLAARLSRPRP